MKRLRPLALIAAATALFAAPAIADTQAQDYARERGSGGIAHLSAARPAAKHPFAVRAKNSFAGSRFDSYHDRNFGGGR